MRRLHASPDLGGAMCDEVPGTPPHRQKRQCVGRDWMLTHTTQLLLDARNRSYQHIWHRVDYTHERTCSLHMYMGASEQDHVLVRHRLHFVIFINFPTVGSTAVGLGITWPHCDDIHNSVPLSSYMKSHWRCFATCVGHLHTLCVRDFKNDCENHRSESISEQNGATADRDLLEAVKAPNHELHSYIETEPHSYIATKAASTKAM